MPHRCAPLCPVPAVCTRHRPGKVCPPKPQRSAGPAPARPDCRPLRPARRPARPSRPAHWRPSPHTCAPAGRHALRPSPAADRRTGVRYTTQPPTRPDTPSPAVTIRTTPVASWPDAASRSEEGSQLDAIIRPVIRSALGHGNGLRSGAGNLNGHGGMAGLPAAIDRPGGKLHPCPVTHHLQPLLLLAVIDDAGREGGCMAPHLHPPDNAHLVAAERHHIWRHLQPRIHLRSRFAAASANGHGPSDQPPPNGTGREENVFRNWFASCPKDTK